MGDLLKSILQVILVVTISVLLCLFVPASMLIELFFVLLAAMIIMGGGLVMMREVLKQRDLRHYYKIQHEVRELKLRTFKREHSLLENRCKSKAQRRLFYY